MYTTNILHIEWLLSIFHACDMYLIIVLLLWVFIVSFEVNLVSLSLLVWAMSSELLNVKDMYYCGEETTIH